jgi:hypothetical protein
MDRRDRHEAHNGSACGYQAIFVPSTALASPGYDGQPAVYLYIAVLEVNVLNCRIPRVRRWSSKGWPGTITPFAATR